MYKEIHTIYIIYLQHGIIYFTPINVNINEIITKPIKLSPIQTQYSVKMRTDVP